MDESAQVSPVAFVTGSGRRLGRRIAVGLAEAGYDIVLHAHRSVDGMREAEQRILELGRRAWKVQGDLSMPAELARVASEALAAASRLDLLVNNAGVFPQAAFEDVTVELWNLALDVNTRAAFFLTQACAPALRLSRGAVVNIASGGAFEPWVAHIPYNVSKAGMVMLTRALAKALAPDVRVNAIAPGFIALPGEDDAGPGIPESRIPLKRYGTADDVTAAVLFLARDARYITGHTLPVDGGSADAT